MKEFKVLIPAEKRGESEQNGLKTFMLKTENLDTNSDQDADNAIPEHYCPYCGQTAGEGRWWTQEQLKYLDVYRHNIVAKLLNESFIKPMKNMEQKSNSGFITIKVESHEIEQQEPWISPEENDLDVFDLPCCQRKVKIDDKAKDTVYCFFCGFPHKHDKYKWR